MHQGESDASTLTTGNGRAASATVALGAAITFIALATMLGLRLDALSSVALDTSGWSLRGTLPPVPDRGGAAALPGGAKPV